MNYVVKKGQYIFIVSVLSQKQGYIFLRERKHVFSIKKKQKKQIRPHVTSTLSLPQELTTRLADVEKTRTTLEQDLETTRGEVASLKGALTNAENSCKQTETTLRKDMEDARVRLLGELLIWPSELLTVKLVIYIH